MSSCCSRFACAAGAQFDVARAKADLARYRKRGPDPTTRMLAEGLYDAVQHAPSVLDVGAGIGVLAHELVDTTFASATVVEASDGYLAVVQEEAERRGNAAQYTLHHGDFVDLASTIPEASAVTMDRVVCCYHAYVPLLNAALGHARQLFAYSYPRDLWYVRLVSAFENLVRRLRRSPFRTFVHSPQAMQSVIERHGFQLTSRKHTLAWSVEVWKRKY